MHILMLVPHYLPDLGPSAPLFSMLSDALLQRGHKVTVLTTVPHYPSGQVPPAFKGIRLRRSLENGIEIIRVPLPSLNRANLVHRFVQFITYQIGAAFAGLRCPCDAVFVANPSLWVFLPFVWLVALRKKPAIFSIYDLYPDVGKTLGTFSSPLVIAGVATLERFCLKHSSVVRIVSDSFRPGLRNLGVPEEKIVLVYDWVDTDLVRPVRRDNGFAREHGLVGKFVVLYAGNMGLLQGLDSVLDAAELLSSHHDLIFLLVGEGAGRAFLCEQVKLRRLANVQFLPFQPRNRIPEVLGSADVSLVTLRKGIGTATLPSKTYSIFASGRPLLASVDEGSDAWNIVCEAKAGVCVPSEDAARLAEAILLLKQNKRLCQDLGGNGRTWAETRHSPQAAARRIEQLLQAALEGNHAR